MLFAAAAAGVAAIDEAFPNVADGEGLRMEAKEARRDGFAGKIAMDPVQARIINEVFASRSVQVTKRPPTTHPT
jgi:citrate lyase subunit beta/citryl-CoA lyase